jgi:hypothetical protein
MAVGSEARSGATLENSEDVGRVAESLVGRLETHGAPPFTMQRCVIAVFHAHLPVARGKCSGK